MSDINELRRLAQAATPGPWKMLPVGDGRQKFAVADSEFLSTLTVTDEGGATFWTVYDDADAKFIAAANPATINDLLDRLEEAESDALEQARLNGMGSEREAALMAKLEAAEKETASWKGLAKQFGNEADALRAKIEPSVPDGWKLVPIEPTPEMLCALVDGANQYDSWNEGYRYMLAAAPEANP